MARIAIITGGGSGIGAGIGKALAAKGDTVILADIDFAAAQGVADEIGDLASARELDVTDAAAVARLVDHTVADFGRIDLMFNNAGIAMGGSSLELTNEHWDHTIDVNLRGVVHGCTAVLPHMVVQGDGHIINTASLAGLIPAAFLAPYAATKHAVVGMTLGMRIEFASRGVRFTALCPGFTETPILDKGVPAHLPQPELTMNARELAGRLPGGVYELDKLIADTMKGVEKNEALIVAPPAAMNTWRAWRTSPSTFLKVVTKQVSDSIAGALA